MENSFWKRLWTCRKTDYGMMMNVLKPRFYFWPQFEKLLSISKLAFFKQFYYYYYYCRWAFTRWQYPTLVQTKNKNNTKQQNNYKTTK